MDLYSYISVLILCTIIGGCKHASQSAPEQGLRGQVWWYEGNFMPGPDSQRQPDPVVREVWIYPLITIQQTSNDGPVYSQINAEVFSKVTTDEDGAFIIALPPGRYSVFTKEPDGLFANLSDGEGNINPVSIEKGKITEIKIDINYKATY